MKRIVLLPLLLCWIMTGSGQQFEHTVQKDQNRPSPAASIHQFEWIAGHWKGEAFGGETEEIWTAPVGNSMMGAFKLSHGENIAFYELLIIRQVERTVLLQLKHFHDDLKGWEEKDETVDFPLVKITNDKAFFDQFTFEKISDDEMHVYVVIQNKDRPDEEVQFVYHRVKS